MNILEKLSAIQSEISVPKDQKNSFGGYNYRSCEDILAKATPLCKKYNVVLTLSDELVNIGDRYYVKAIAHLESFGNDGDFESMSVTAYAREEAEKKGMDGSQITGASSSYARKYALNGLFCLDDVKDSDYTNQGVTKDDLVPQNKYTKPAQKPVGTISNLCKECGAAVTPAVKTYSEKNYGSCLCVDCQKKYGRN